MRCTISAGSRSPSVLNRPKAGIPGEVCTSTLRSIPYREQAFTRFHKQRSIPNPRRHRYPSSRRAGVRVPASPRLADPMPAEGNNVTHEVPSTSSRTTEKTHLVLFVNGLNGNDDNWSVVIANLRKHAAVKDIAILASTANMRLQVN